MSYSLEEIRKAKAEYEKMIEDNEAVKYLLMQEEIAEMDRAQMRSNAREEGLAEGRAEGRAEGGKEAKMETAKKMLELGAEIEFIEKVTGITKEEIEKLK